MPNLVRNYQSPYTANDFWANHGSATPKECILLKVTATDSWGGEVIGFTSNSRDMTMPEHSGVTFKAKVGLSPSNIEIALNAASNLELAGIYQDDSITRQDVINGKWVGAKVELMVVSWGNTDLGEWLVHVGRLGEFTDLQNSFKVESRGNLALLSNTINVVTSKLCRHRVFGGLGCNKDLSGQIEIDGDYFDFINILTVDTVHSQTEIDFASVLDFPDWFYTAGKAKGDGNELNSLVSRNIESAAMVSGSSKSDYLKDFLIPSKSDSNTN